MFDSYKTAVLYLAQHGDDNALYNDGAFTWNLYNLYDECDDAADDHSSGYIVDLTDHSIWSMDSDGYRERKLLWKEEGPSVTDAPSLVTVVELIAVLQRFPPDMRVFLQHQDAGGYYEGSSPISEVVVSGRKVILS